MKKEYDFSKAVNIKDFCSGMFYIEKEEDILTPIYLDRKLIIKLEKLSKIKNKSISNLATDILTHSKYLNNIKRRSNTLKNKKHKCI